MAKGPFHLCCEWFRRNSTEHSIEKVALLLQRLLLLLLLLMLLLLQLLLLLLSFSFSDTFRMGGIPFTIAFKDL